MSILFAVLFSAPIHLFYHPQVMVNGVCIAEPGTLAALYCAPVDQGIKKAPPKGRG
jgi:hypothetical protein